MEVMAALAVGEADGAADGEVDGAVAFGLPMVQVVIFFNVKQFYKIFLDWQSLRPTLFIVYFLLGSRINVIRVY